MNDVRHSSYLFLLTHSIHFKQKSDAADSDAADSSPIPSQSTPHPKRYTNQCHNAPVSVTPSLTEEEHETQSCLVTCLLIKSSNKQW